MKRFWLIPNIWVYLAVLFAMVAAMAAVTAARRANACRYLVPVPAHPGVLHCAKPLNVEHVATVEV